MGPISFLVCARAKGEWDIEFIDSSGKKRLKGEHTLLCFDFGCTVDGWEMMREKKEALSPSNQNPLPNSILLLYSTKFTCRLKISTICFAFLSLDGKMCNVRRGNCELFEHSLGAAFISAEGWKKSLQLSGGFRAVSTSLFRLRFVDA